MENTNVLLLVIFNKELNLQQQSRTRGNTGYNFMHVSCTCDTYMHINYPKTVLEWNNFPDSVV